MVLHNTGENKSNWAKNQVGRHIWNERGKWKKPFIRNTNGKIVPNKSGGRDQKTILKKDKKKSYRRPHSVNQTKKKTEKRGT